MCGPEAEFSGWSILTNDGGLKRCMEILRTEGLLL
jgi:hypothetical protein